MSLTNEQIQELSNAVVSAWNFDEGSGTTAFDSKGSNDITMSHSGILGGAGKINNGADFSGGNDRIGTSNACLTGVTDFTICMWVRFPDNTIQFFFDNRNGTTSSNRIFLSRQSHTSDAVGRRIRFFFNNGTTSTSIYSPNDTNDNEWYLIGIQQVGLVMKIFINGTEVNTLTRGSGSVLQSGTWKWGNHYEISATFTGLKGNMDIPIVFNKGLTNEEWQFIYNSGAGRQYPYSSSNGNFLMFF